MFSVIDTIQMSEVLFGHHPEWRARYGSVGLLVVLDPWVVPEVPVPADTRFRVHRPDGTSAEYVATLAERPSTAVGLFFPRLTPVEIPRLSQLEPLTPPPSA